MSAQSGNPQGLSNATVFFPEWSSPLPSLVQPYLSLRPTSVTSLLKPPLTTPRVGAQSYVSPQLNSNSNSNSWHIWGTVVAVSVCICS